MSVASKIKEILDGLYDSIEINEYKNPTCFDISYTKSYEATAPGLKGLLAFITLWKI